MKKILQKFVYVKNNQYLCRENYVKTIGRLYHRRADAV